MGPTTDVNVNINVTANTAGVDQAESSLGGFSGILSGIASVAGGIGLASIFNDIGSSITGAISQVSQFQQSTVAVNNTLGNIGDTMANVADVASGSSAKVKNALQEETDATISYQEKVANLQDKIAEVMKGDNVIDAQANMYYQLDQLAEQHANRVEALEDQIAQVQLNEANNLQDMTDSHNVRMQDLAEKHDQEMADASSDSQRRVLQVKYDQEVQYENDSFARQYALKKSQLDRDAAQKIDSINQEIAQENTAYQEKYDHEKAMDDQRIADLQATNAKELAQYKQQLGDEERAYNEHMAKLKETAANAGGGSSGGMMSVLPTESEWRAQAGSLQQWMDQVNKAAQVSPFNYADMVNYGRLVETQGYNYLKLLPIIQNIAAATGQSFGTTTQALLDGINGRTYMMQMDLGISKEKLEEFGAEYSKGPMGHLTNQESFFTAIEKMSKTEFAGAQTAELHTLQGAWSNVQDSIFRTTASLLGFNSATANSSGAFSGMTQLMLDFSNWLMSNQGNIDKFFQGLNVIFTGLVQVIEFLFGKVLIPLGQFLITVFTPVWNKLELIWKQHQQALTILGEILLGLVVGAIVAVAEVAAALLDGILNLVNEFLTFVDVIRGIVAPAIDYMQQHWQAFLDFFLNMGVQIMQMATNITNSVIDMINNVINAINTLLGNQVFTAGVKILTGISLPKQIPTIGHVSMGSSSSGPQQSGGGSSSLNQAIAKQNGGVNITNYNTFNTSADPNAFAKTLGLQVSLASH